MKTTSFSSSIAAAPRWLALTAALGGALMLAACGGGDDDDSGSPAQSPKPNPVTTPPTLTCSAAGIAASNASTAARTVCMLTSDGEIVIERHAVSVREPAAHAEVEPALDDGAPAVADQPSPEPGESPNA